MSALLCPPVSVERRWIWAVLAAVNLLFYLSSAYITTSNDGSHFALVSALVGQHTIVIDPYVAYTQQTDFCFKDGHYYSDRPPGTALLAAPFYALGKIVRLLRLDHLLSRHGNYGEIAVIFLPNLAGTLVVWLMFRLLLHFGCRPPVAMVTALVCALGTPIWFESTRLYSHILSMTAILSAASLAITAEAGAGLRRRLIPLAVLLGLASIVEIQNILFVPAFALYLALSGKVREGGLRPWVKAAAQAALAFGAVYAVLLLYNHTAFGEWTIKSNQYNPGFPEEAGFSSALSGNVLAGLDRLYTSFGNQAVLWRWEQGTRNEAPGLLAWSPILVLSLLSYPTFIRRHRAEALFFLALIVIDTGVAAVHATVLTRHISTILPFLALPCFLPIRWAFGDAARIRRYATLALLAGLFAFSAGHVYYVMNTSWRRSLSDPWKFSAELPSYFLFWTLCALGYVLWSRRGAKAGEGPLSQ